MQAWIFVAFQDTLGANLQLVPVAATTEVSPHAIYMRFYRQVNAVNAPPEVAKYASSNKGKRGALLALYEDWLQNDRQWANCSLLAAFTREHESSRRGRHRLFTKDELLARYKKQTLVDDLCERRAKAGQRFPNQDFPDDREQDLFLCWDSTVVDDVDRAKQTTTLQMQGDVDKKCCQQLATNADLWKPAELEQARPAPAGRGGKTRGRGKNAAADPPDADGEGGPPEKPQDTKARNPLKVARGAVSRKVKDLSTYLLQVQGWPQALRDNTVPEDMIVAATRTSDELAAKLTALRQELEQTLVRCTTDTDVPELEALVDKVSSMTEQFQAASVSVKRLLAPAPKAKGKANAGKAK